MVDLLGLDLLTKSFGLHILFQGVGAFIGAPIAGEWTVKKSIIRKDRWKVCVEYWKKGLLVHSLQTVA